MKQIIHLITTIERGGAENQLVILAREQRKLGLKVQVVYLKGFPSLVREFESMGVKVTRLVGNPLKQILGLRSILKHSNADALHAHLPRAELIASFAIHKLPLIISRHNAERFMPKGPAWLSRRLSRFVVRKSSGRIAISSGVNQFIESSDESVPGYTFSTVHYGYEFCRKKAVKKPDQIGPMRFIAIGRLVPQKDYETLIVAMSMLHKRNPNFRLTILGEGPLEAELKSLAKSLGVSHSILWLGKVDNVFEYLLESDFFILSSIYEGFGMVILEAIDAGVPIVCSNITTLEEILGTNYKGLFMVKNPESLCKTLLYASGHVSELLEQMELKKKLFDSEAMTKSIIGIYENALLRFKG